MATSPGFFGSLFNPRQQVSLSPSDRAAIANGGNAGNTGGAGGAPGAPGAGGQPPNNQPGSSMQLRNPGAVADPNGGGQPGGQPGGQGGQPQGSPLDGFTKLWQTDPANPVKQPADPFSEPLFQVGPDKIKEMAGQMDFIQQVPQELLQKAMSGNDPQAFMSVINAVAQNVMASALQVSSGLVEQGGRKMGERYKTAFPNMFRDHQIDGAAPTNPMLSHPAMKPFLQMARTQVKMMNPDLTPDQITAEAERYLTTVMNLGPASKEGAGAGGAGGGNSGAGDFDWGSWLTGSNSQGN